jgi:hypothetical protein
VDIGLDQCAIGVLALQDKRMLHAGDRFEVGLGVDVPIRGNTSNKVADD